MYRKLVQTDQGYQSHQLLSDLDTYIRRFCSFLKMACNPPPKKKTNPGTNGSHPLRGRNEGIFALWSISSPIRVQIAQELVRLITLIGLNRFLIHIISPRPLKKCSWTTFRWSILRKRTFLVVIRLL